MSETAETAETVEAADRIKPWTVKGIPPEERNAAIAAAEREGMTIGEWLTRAIRTEVQADHQSDRLPAPLEAGVSSSDRQADLSEIERMVALAEKISQANGKPIPTGITRATHGLLREHLKGFHPDFNGHVR